MKHNCVILFITGALLATLAGCGTVTNLTGKRYAFMCGNPSIPPVAFGGVGRDVWWFCNCPWNVFFLLDLPFSLVGDVITLPKILWDTDWDNPTPWWAFTDLDERKYPYPRSMEMETLLFIEGHLETTLPEDEALSGTSFLPETSGITSE